MIAVNLHTQTITYSSRFPDDKARYDATVRLWKANRWLDLFYYFPVKAHDEEDTTVTEFTVITTMLPKNNWEIVR